MAIKRLDQLSSYGADYFGGPTAAHASMLSQTNPQTGGLHPGKPTKTVGIETPFQGPATTKTWSPYATTGWTPPKTSGVAGSASLQEVPVDPGGEDGGGKEPGAPNPAGSLCPEGYKHVVANNARGFDCVPETGAGNCPEGYEWENLGGPAGRCKVKGTRWEDNCFIRDGVTYCDGDTVPWNTNNTPAPTSGPSGPSTPKTSPIPGPGGPPPNLGIPTEPWQAPTPTPFENEIQKQLEDFLKNWSTDVPFTDEVIRNMKTDAFSSSHGRTNVNRDAIESEMARRGVLSSTSTDRRVDAMKRANESEYSRAERDITGTATAANFQARTTNRLAALDRATSFLNSQREYLLTSDMNDFTKKAKMADLALAYHNLEQQKWALENQFEISRTQFAQTLAQNKSQFNQNMDWNKILLQWQIANGLGV